MEKSAKEQDLFEGEANKINVGLNSLRWQGKTYRCAIGRSGISADKHEGDGATPAGSFSIRKVFYRADRVEKPISVFETIKLSERDGWSDDIKKPDYNRHITLPKNGSHERLWREDHCYDIIVILGYNDAPTISGKGSAIFMHVARESYLPTDGWIALSLNDLEEILATCAEDTRVVVRYDRLE